MKPTVDKSSTKWSWRKRSSFDESNPQGVSKRVRRGPVLVLAAFVASVLANGMLNTFLTSSRQSGTTFKAKQPVVNRIVQEKESERLDRVYCMVPFLWNEQSGEAYEEIMETWGKRCDIIRFMIDPIIEDEDGGYVDLRQNPNHFLHENPNIVVINMTRTWNDCKKPPCRHIWEKMWRSWVWVDENEKDKAEWFAKVDYDTFFFPENVVRFVRDERRWKPTEDHYFGHKIYSKVPTHNFTFAVGAANFLSKSTLEKLADIYRKMPSNGNKGERGKCEDRAHASEELTTAVCLKEHLGIEAEDTLDPEYREHITTAEYHHVLKWNRTEQGEWWYWEGKSHDVQEMEDCCSHFPIGFHRYKKRGQLRTLDQQFYGPSDNKEIKRLDPRTRRYVNKVRKAMNVSLDGDKNS